jgi:hypothetical protein
MHPNSGAPQTGRLLRIGAVLVLLASMLLTVGVSTTPAAASTPNASPGYWLVGADGGVYQFGTTNFGALRGRPLARPVVGGASTANGLGYWLVASDGGIFAFGDAGFAGSTGGIRLNRPIVGMAADPATGGYWMVASDGGVFSFRAPFFGSTGGIRLAKPIVGMAVTPDAKGYWLVASDGGVFSFGDAGFFGSTGNVRLAQPVVGVAATPSGRGYWLVASDGGIFTFGDARFDGSTGKVRLFKPIRGMAATSDGGGYWLVASDGGMFTFGDAPFLGSTGSAPGPAPIVAVVTTRHGYPFPPGATGNDIAWPQCPVNGGTIPPAHRLVSIVQVSNGSMNDPNANPCYRPEAAWAGSNMSAYIFVDGLPSPAPSESLSGPAGVCHGSVACQSYNFGYWWAVHWVNYSRSLGINPTLWWLDVETDGSWNLSSSAQPSNARVIAGAVAGLRVTGGMAGIYATAYQWGVITGSNVSFPGIPLWVAGAGNVSGGSYSAETFCSGPVAQHEPFAGGSVVLVQYGYAPFYTGPTSRYDQDYACK